MKYIKIISRLGLALFAIIFVLTFGCNESSSPSFISSSTPTTEQIKSSLFANFVNELNKLPVDKRLTELQRFINDNPTSPIIENNSLACFNWYGKASSVLINGDIQYGWAVPDTMNLVSCGGNNFFYKIYSLPADARIDYQFIVDDSIITDPRNPIITPSGFGEHSQCAMPMFKSKTVLQYRTNINYGTVDSLLFQSTQTSMQPRMLKIYKPAGYDSLAELPVIFVNDGFKAIEYCFYINVLDNLIADKKIKPVIVVFINFVEGDQDYFLNKTDEYFTAICSELVPLIDANFKTSKKAKDRLLTGISTGAHISLLTVLKKSDVFLNAAGQSPTTTEALFDAVNSASIDKHTKKGLKLYFDVGRFDLRQGGIENHSFLYSNQLLSREMKSAGINHHFKVFNDGHEWANWRERVDEILIYFFGN
jgi:enterochelin esterase family protein